MRGVEEFLADADDVIADWEGSDDAAAWAADGSHEHFSPLELSPLPVLPFPPLFTPEVWAQFMQEVRRAALEMMRRHLRAAGVPVPPRPRTSSGMTARQYRAARRRFRRVEQAHRRATGCTADHSRIHVEVR